MAGPQSERTVGKPIWVFIFALDDLVAHNVFIVVVEW